MHVTYEGCSRGANVGFSAPDHLLKGRTCMWVSFGVDPRSPSPQTLRREGRSGIRSPPRNFTANTRSILSRTYLQLLTDPDITQLGTNLPPLRYNQTKGLTCRPNGKMPGQQPFWPTPTYSERTRKDYRCKSLKTPLLHK